MECIEDILCLAVISVSRLCFSLYCAISCYAILPKHKSHV